MSAPTRFAGTTGHPVGETKTGLAAGMDKGMQLTKRALPVKHSYRKGPMLLNCCPALKLLGQKLNKRVQFVREVIRELLATRDQVVGFAPYEKRTMELLKVGREKRALKLLKVKLGTHKRAKAKREECAEELRKQRMK
ncbi:hypothetical protein AB1Y20_011122 [Prymnesium parvum]|uniref:60S ribosomal protein L36 n=1 Tax=Prymnesium parvum TaxID=97485 RepID=A0AB34ILQ6_PRYPA